MAVQKINSKEISQKLKEAKNVAIFGHILPDSDCYGSAIGLKCALESMGKKTFVYLPDKLPYFLEFLNNYKTFSQEKEYKSVDIAIVVDSSSIKRVVSSESLIQMKENNVPVILIDHHLSGDLLDFADFTWQDTGVSSVSEMILEIVRNMNVKINKDIATPLLTGIEGDTGSFQHQNTTENSFETAAYLMSKGARFKSVIDNTVNAKRDINIIKLYGIALERLIYNKKYKTATTYITLKDLKKYGFEGRSGSEIINFLNIIEGVKMIFLISERDEENIKVSLRTSDEKIDVQQLASRFGGGGHVKASGFTIRGKIVNINGRVKITY